MATRALSTLGEFKRALRQHKLPLYVWCAWEGDDGDYIEVSRAAFLRGIGAAVSFDRGGKCDGHQIHFDVRPGDGIYIG